MQLLSDLSHILITHNYKHRLQLRTNYTMPREPKQDDAHVKQLSWRRSANAFLVKVRAQQVRDETDRLSAEALAVKRNIDRELKNWPELENVFKVGQCFPPFGSASDDDVAAAIRLPTTRANLRLKCEVIGSRESNSKPSTLAGHAARLSKVMQYCGATEHDVLEEFIVTDSQGVWDAIQADSTVAESTKAQYVTSVQWVIDHRVLSLTPAQIAAVRPVWANLFSTNKNDSLTRTATTLASTVILDYNDILGEAEKYARSKPQDKNAQLLLLTLLFYKEANVRNEFASINVV